jgi:hypothetical protein
MNTASLKSHFRSLWLFNLLNIWISQIFTKWPWISRTGGYINIWISQIFTKWPWISRTGDYINIWISQIFTKWPWISRTGGYNISTYGFHRFSQNGHESPELEVISTYGFHRFSQNGQESPELDVIYQHMDFTDFHKINVSLCKRISVTKICCSLKLQKKALQIRSNP